MSLEASRKSVFEAHRQADIAENSLFETLRPWVNLESLELYSDATWKDGQFELEVRIRVKNVGHNPALSVSVATQLVTIFPNKAVVTELRKMCDLRRELMPGALGSDTGTLFPDQEADSIVWGLSVNRDDVDAARQFFKETAKLEDYIIMPAISLIACVDYLIPGNTKHHQTGRIYSISARDNVPPNSITGFRHNQDVRKELLTSVHELHGDFAD